MRTPATPAPVSIDLAALHARTVTSFYSALVTRPTGRAIRMGVEGQLGEIGGTPGRILSILDFTQVHLLDYSCADEIVAKLLLRYVADDRPAAAYFVARGLQEHHLEAVEAVLDHHRLLLVAEAAPGSYALLGPTEPAARELWLRLTRRGRAPAGAHPTAAPDSEEEEAAAELLALLTRQRVALVAEGGIVISLPALVAGTPGSTGEA
jgi:hypothetical protein